MYTAPAHRSTEAAPPDQTMYASLYLLVVVDHAVARGATLRAPLLGALEVDRWAASSSPRLLQGFARSPG